MKQITQKQFNTLSKDIILNLGAESHQILHDIGFTNPSDLIHALTEAQGVEVVA